MAKGELKLYLPNPHGGDLSGPFVARIFRQAGLTLKSW